ncbi:HAD hydrolase-like protein [Butyrivibrio sp. YAB3001]|uniref:HAD hydrolase-like protein n=1 Tax=Butyrivibrio sp. YAB3001 TaxID=1520812 RepID=UPI0008F652F0|nr:HAD hydrolase-like protein [Butyrivibrio sp. YAB3001]SFB88909.1 Haloacid dehalogenase-like hydrolase [Butyrivibrio sp. YAB3001]
MADSKKIETIYNRCKLAKVISFDVFGTLITRDVVEPDDVIRIAKTKKNGREVVGENKEDIEALYEVEMSIVHPIDDMIFVMRRLKQNGKVIILTSDMYLNGQMIENLLENIGVIKGIDYDWIFVSSDYGCTKKDGGLYKLIQQEIHVSFEEMVHIGDAIRSDYLIPRMLGIKAIWYKSEKNRSVPEYRNNELRNLNRFIENHMSVENYEYEIGYKFFGPLLYGFANWLNDRISERNEPVFFLAREGFIFLKALEIMGMSQENMKYMLISRRSIIGSLLWIYDDIDEMIKSLHIDRKISFEKVIALLNVQECLKNDRASLKLLGRIYTSSTEIIDDEETYSFLFRHISEIKEKSKSQYDAMEKYLQSIEFDTQDDCTMVDIGWVGTMQRYLNDYIKTRKYSKRIKGLYLGVHINNYNEDPKEGYLFNGDSVKKQRDIFSFVGLLESVFSEQDGSVKHYCQRGDSYEIERCGYEYDENDAKKIAMIQQGMLDFVRDMHNSGIKHILFFDQYLSTFNLLKFGNNPSKKDLDFFRTLVFSDESYSLNSGFGLKTLSIKDFKNNFMNSIWKTAYLKCTFGSWFPAKAFYDCLYGLKKNT